MTNYSDMDDYQGVAQKLNFTTPKKERAYDGNYGSTANDFTRNLFESHKKVSGSSLTLAMPCIVEAEIRDKTSDALLKAIYEKIEAKWFQLVMHVLCYIDFLEIKQKAYYHIRSIYGERSSALPRYILA